MAGLSEGFFDARARLAREQALHFPLTSDVRPVAQPVVEVQPTLVLDSLERERSFVTVPIREEALVATDYLLSMTGRLVEAETANRNGAFWSTSDLEHGVGSVSMGPLNWLHQERKIVGALGGATLVGKETAAAQGIGPHIAADAVMWKYIYPEEAALVQQAAEQGKLWYSMECISRQVECAGANGCGASMPYVDALRKEGAACQHVRERSSSRRFVDPVFQGAALILPPVEPGWENAHIELIREAASKIEGGEALGMDDTHMLAQMLDFIRTPRSVA